MSTVGAFGKLPARGDFITFGLPAAFTDPWHAWLVRGLAAARVTLGDGFEAAYASAPVWRFALPAGVAGEARVAGVMLPSWDAVGRLFPLTLAMVGGALPAISALLAAESWFDALEAHGRGALDAAVSLEEWAAMMGGVADVGLAAGPVKGADAARAVLADRAGGQLSVFWTDGCAGRVPDCRTGRGLPEGTGFVGLMRKNGGEFSSKPISNAVLLRMLPVFGS